MGGERRGVVTFRAMLGLFMLLVISLAAVVLLGSAMMWHRLTRPPRKTYAWAVSRGRPGTPGELSPPRAFSEVVHVLAGGEYPGWEIPGEAPGGVTIIFTPGWGDSRLGVLPRLSALAPYARRVIAWDPPGLGAAPGTCALGMREPGLLRALIESSARGGGEAVVLFGSSLGAGVSIAAASGNPRVRGVVAEAPYRMPWTPAFGVMRLAALPHRINGAVVFGVLGMVRADPLWRRFDRAALARGVSCPLLVVHGERDEVCPVRDGREIAEAAPRGRLCVIPGGTHNGMWTDEQTRGETACAVSEFLRVIAGETGGA